MRKSLPSASNLLKKYYCSDMTITLPLRSNSSTFFLFFMVGGANFSLPTALHINHFLQWVQTHRPPAPSFSVQYGRDFLFRADNLRLIVICVMPIRRCFYEELGVSQAADENEIRRAYRVAALASHPDKNVGAGEAEAAERFKAVQHAYEVLSDPHERAWYDSHRNQILRGRDPSHANQDELSTTSAEASEVDLFAYFTSTAYNGYGDEPDSFYSVFGQVFETLAREERTAGLMDALVQFGTSQSDWSTVRDFYRDWSGFTSKKSFGFADKWNLADAPNRDYRRVMERENKRERAKMKKEFNSLVRELVSFVKKRDPRVKARKDVEEEEKAAREEIARRKEEQYRANRKAQAAHTRAQRDEALEEDADALDEILAQVALDELIEHDRKINRGQSNVGATIAQESSDGEAADGCESDAHTSDEDERYQDESISERRPSAATTGNISEESSFSMIDLFCITCRKKFRTEPQMKNHLQSKKHVASAAKLRSQLVEEDARYLPSFEKCDSEKSYVQENENADNAVSIAKNRKTRRRQHRRHTVIESDTETQSDDKSSHGNNSLDNENSNEFGQAEALVGNYVETLPAGAEDKESQQTSGVVEASVYTEKASKSKLDRREKRRQKRRDKAYAQDVAPADPSDNEHKCNVCGTYFTSRNRLFCHVRETNHAIHVDAQPKTSNRRKRQ